MIEAFASLDAPLTGGPVHVCLVSEQTFPNLVVTGLRAGQAEGFPAREMVLLVTATMRPQATWLAEVLEGLQIPASAAELEREFDIASLLEQMEALAERLRGRPVLLNATGGTKPMALAGYLVFSERGWFVYYVDRNTGRVLWLDREGRPPLPPPRWESVDTMLAVYGAKVGKPPGNRMPEEGWEPRVELAELVRNAGMEEDSWRRAAGRLIGERQRLHGALAAVNALAGQARAPRRPWEEARSARAEEAPGPVTREIIEAFCGIGLCAWDENERRLVFPNEPARSFVHSGWVKFHVADVLERHAAAWGISDVRTGLHVRTSNKAKNELDVVFLANNALHVVECKTSGQTEQNAKANQIIYQLNFLRRFGGLSTKVMLASYAPLGAEARRRAHDAGVAVVDGEALADLEGALEAWIRGGMSLHLDLDEAPIAEDNDEALPEAAAQGTAYFVTRHSGAAEWARRQGIEAHQVDHIDPDQVGPGDVVMGTLPVHLAAAVCARGARYRHLSIDIPPEVRGHDLSADDMERYGARLEEYRVELLDR